VLAFIRGVAWFCIALTCGSVRAAYPDRAISIVIPYPPGGTADVLARPLAASMQRALGVPVVLLYKPGASGAIATQYVARAAPDGYTLLMAAAAHAINPSLYANLPYDSVRDFSAVSLVAKVPLVMYGNPSKGVCSIQAVVRYAKEHPGRLAIASAGHGNTSHLALEQFTKSAGLDVIHVPYKGGSDSVQSVIAGDTDVVFAGADSLKYVEMGRLCAIAVAGPAKLSMYPQLPTFAEQGLPDVRVEGWYGLLAPRSTPQSAVMRLDNVVASAPLDPSFHAAVADLGFESSHAPPAAFMNFISQERARWKRLIDRLKIRLD
jgi:tripartite-type tricarboxylate transporter receptor subunit TctC